MASTTYSSKKGLAWHGGPYPGPAAPPHHRPTARNRCHARHNSLPELADTDDQQLLAQVIDHYHQTLKETTEGRNYLFRRGITNPEAIDRSRIGFVDYSLAEPEVPSSRLDAGKALRARLRAVLGVSVGSPTSNSRAAACSPIMAADGSGGSLTSTVAAFQEGRQPTPSPLVRTPAGRVERRSSCRR